MSKRYRKGVLGLDPALDKRERRAYEKVQRMVEKKEAKKLDKWITDFAKGKNWL